MCMCRSQVLLFIVILFANILPLWHFSFYSLSGVFWWKEGLDLNVLHLISVFFMVSICMYCLRNLHLFQGRESTFLFVYCRCFIVLPFTLRRWEVEVNFHFSSWVTNRLSIINWQDHCFLTAGQCHLCHKWNIHTCASLFSALSICVSGLTPLNIFLLFFHVTPNI